MKRRNYNIKPCIFAANYTFIRCGQRNLHSKDGKHVDYWGNIRFAQHDYEEKIIEYIHTEDRSRMQYVDIYGAGMLHGEKGWSNPNDICYSNHGPHKHYNMPL